MIGLLPGVMDAVCHVGEGEVGVKYEVGLLLRCDGSDGLRQQALGGPELGHMWLWIQVQKV